MVPIPCIQRGLAHGDDGPKKSAMQPVAALIFNVEIQLPQTERPRIECKASCVTEASIHDVSHAGTWSLHRPHVHSKEEGRCNLLHFMPISWGQQAPGKLPRQPSVGRYFNASDLTRLIPLGISLV